MNKNLISTIAAMTVIFSNSALASGSRPYFECQVTGKDGVGKVKILISPTGTRSGNEAYQLTSDQDSPNNPGHYELAMNLVEQKHTAGEFMARFHYKYGFFSTEPGNAVLKIDRRTGVGSYHRSNLMERHLFGPNEYATLDIAMTGCREIANPYAETASTSQRASRGADEAPSVADAGVSDAGAAGAR